MKKKIFIQDWLQLKPYDKQVSTDSYYLKISNKIKNIIDSPKHLFYKKYLNEADLILLSCFLVSYFEDTISQTNLWNAFINKHLELYGKPLPFYSTEEYYNGEINEQDVAFLIWYFLNTRQKEDLISPFSKFISNLSGDVMEIFEEQFEVAPENEELKSFFQIGENEEDYYVVRNFIDHVLFKNYLFISDAGQKLRESELELMEEKSPKLLSYLNENHDSLLHSHYTRLLGLKGKDWAAEILGNNHGLYHHLLNISPKVRGFFLYKGQDKNYIHLEHVASGKLFKLLIVSFDDYHQLKDIDTMVYIGLVKWKENWWFSGVYFSSNFNQKVINEERESFETKMNVAFLYQRNSEFMEILETQRELFFAFNKNSPIAFIPTEILEGFIQDFMDFYNKSLGASEAAIDEVKQKGMFQKKGEKSLDYSEYSEEGLLFFNPNSGIEMAFGLNSAFPDPLNPFYNEDNSMEEVLHLLISKNISKELALYCITHYQDKLAFFKKEPGNLFLKDMDFLLRFWKGENYYSKPALTIR